jgi:hypothetical protein
MQRARGQSLLKPGIKALDFCRGKPLQFEAAKHWQNVHPKQLGIAFL